MEKATPQEIQSRAIDAINETGIPFTVTVNRPNILHRLRILPKRRTFVLYPLKLGSLLKMSSVILTIDDVDGKFEKPEVTMFELLVTLVSRNADKMVEVIAIAIQNSDKPTSRRFKKFLLDNLSASEMAEVLVNVMTMMELADFFRSIVSVRGANILARTMKKENGQTSGASSEESSSTTGSDGEKSSGSEAGQTS